jgi:glyoxylase-like metal-dependent hydrolase (beta-lactamase superfamily II)
VGSTLVDTGPSARWRAVREWVTTQSARRPIERIVLTHHHEDHAGNAARLQALLDVPVYAPAASLERLRGGFHVPMYRRLVWGAPGPVEAEPVPRTLPLAEDLSLHALPAPGHSDDMTCYLVPETGWLFTGDLFLSRRPTLLRAEADLGRLMQSLGWVLQHPVEVVFCGHRGVVTDGRQALREKLRYLEALRGVVVRRHRRGRQSQKTITRETLGREGWITWLTGGAYAKRHLVAACLAAEARPDEAVRLDGLDATDEAAGDGAADDEPPFALRPNVAA